MLNSYKYKRWTPASRECYGRGCVCNNLCSNFIYCKSFLKSGLKPPMKYTVLALVKHLGIPVITRDSSYGDF